MTPTWVLGNVTSNVPPSANNWVAGSYSLGDVVIDQASDGSGRLCCYVFVYDPIITTAGYNINISPANYYTFYNASYLANDGINANAALVWIPCDISCAGIGQPITYSCDTSGGTAITVQDSCASKTDTGFIGTQQAYNLYIAQFYPNTNVSTLKFINPSNSWGGGTIPNPCPAIDNGTVVGWYMYMQYFHVAGPGGGLGSAMQNATHPQGYYYTWTNFINELNTTGLLNTTLTTSMTYFDVEQEVIDINGYGIHGHIWPCDCLTGNTGGNPCGCGPCPANITCAYTSMTECERHCCRYDCIHNTLTGCKCMTMPGGPYLNEHECETSTLNNNCCYTGVTGTPSGVCWFCMTIYPVFETQDLDGIYNILSYSPSVTPGTLDNTATGQGNIYAETWTSGSMYGELQIVLSPLDGCCYIHVGDHLLNPTGTTLVGLYDPSICWANWLLGLACDGSTWPSTVALNQGQGSVWHPCDEMCGAPPTWDCVAMGTPCTINVLGTGNYASPPYPTPMDAYTQCIIDCTPVNPTHDCDDCATTLINYIPPNYNGVPSIPITYYPLPLVGSGPIGLGPGDCVTHLADGCCWCCVCPDGWSTNMAGQNYCNPPGPIINQSHTDGNDMPQIMDIPPTLEPQASSVPSPCSVEVIMNGFGFEESILTSLSPYNTDWMSCAITPDGAPCGPGSGTQVECELCCFAHPGSYWWVWQPLGSTIACDCDPNTPGVQGSSIPMSQCEIACEVCCWNGSTTSPAYTVWSAPMPNIEPCSCHMTGGPGGNQLPMYYCDTWYHGYQCLLCCEDNNTGVISPVGMYNMPCNCPGGSTQVSVPTTWGAC